MPILQEFVHFPNEVARISRIMAGYAILELDLMHCVQNGLNQDLDTALKSMFRLRGEKRRIEEADRLGRECYQDLGVGAEFERAIGAIDYCREIRNQYAHCTWWDDYSGQLAFANLEDLAKTTTTVTSLSGLAPCYVNVSLLQEQLDYYEYTDKLILWVLHRGNEIAGRPAIPISTAPNEPTPPPFFIDEL
jgi:hypothetical protein